MGEKIQIFGIEETGGQERGLFKKSTELRLGRGEIDADVLKDRLAGFLDAMQSVVDSLPAVLGDFRLDSVSLATEISAKGSVSLLGTGGEVSGKGGITFNLIRKVTNEPNRANVEELAP